MESSSPDEGHAAVPDRERLLRFARIMGAGPDSENAVREALQAVAGPDREGSQQVWPLLANILAERAADRYRQVARAQILVRHRARVAHPPPLRGHLAGRTEASWTAQQLVALPRDVLDALWSHHIGGATWEELAAHRRVSPGRPDPSGPPSPAHRPTASSAVGTAMTRARTPRAAPETTYSKGGGKARHSNVVT